MLRYRPWQYTKYSLRALPCLTQIRLGNLSQRLIGEEYYDQDSTAGAPAPAVSSDLYGLYAKSSTLFILTRVLRLRMAAEMSSISSAREGSMPICSGRYLQPQAE